MEEILAKFDLVPLDVPMILLGTFLFFLTTRGIGRALFAPYLALYEKREEKTIGAEHKAETDRLQAEALRHQYEERLRNERIEAQKSRLLRLNQAKDQGAGIISAAEAAAHSYTQQMKKELERERRELRAEVLNEAEAIGHEAAERLQRELGQGRAM